MAVTIDELMQLVQSMAAKLDAITIPTATLIAREVWGTDLPVIPYVGLYPSNGLLPSYIVLPVDKPKLLPSETLFPLG